MLMLKSEQNRREIHPNIMISRVIVLVGRGGLVM